MDIIIEQFPKLLRKKLKGHIKKIILFGSKARGDSSNRSDYDFAVIVDKRTNEIEDTVDDVSGQLLYEYSELIGPIIWDEKEWEDRKLYPIGLNIIKEGVEL